MTNIGQRDAEFLRQAIAQSRLALERGNRPYGAVLVGADGQVLAEGTGRTKKDAEQDAAKAAYEDLPRL